MKPLKLFVVKFLKVWLGLEQTTHKTTVPAVGEKNLTFPLGNVMGQVDT